MDLLITSPRNTRVKLAIKLRDRRGRDKQQRMIIDGLREVAAALDAGLAIEELFISEEAEREPSVQQIVERVECEAHVLRVSKSVFEKLAFGKRHEGIVATAATPAPRLDDVQLPENALIVVLEAIEKPGNLGAILRSADAAGVSALVAADPRTDLFNPNAIRASLGAIFQTPLAVATTDAAIDWLVAQDLAIYAARVDGEVEYSAADFTRPCAVVLGSEADGLSERWNREEVTGISLPMMGRVDSLNVSAAASVLFYEALRQRRG